GDDGPTHQVVVTVQVLGGALDDQIETKLERPLKIGRTEAVVAGRQHAAALTDLGDGAQVEDAQPRVGRALGPDQGGAWADRGVEQVEVGQVEELGLKPQVTQHLDVQTIGVAIDVVREQDVVAGLQ